MEMSQLGTITAVVAGVLVCYSSGSSTVNPGGGTTAGDLGSTFTCYTCYGNESSCNTDGFHENDFTSMEECDGGHCWAVLLKSQCDGDFVARGCDVNLTFVLSAHLEDYSGELFEKSCDSDVQEDEVCFDVGGRIKLCTQCCSGEDSCNDWILTGHSGASSRPESPVSAAGYLLLSSALLTAVQYQL